jgi:molybdopterin synthase catalytic subunit
MKYFELTDKPLEPEALKALLRDPGAGGFVSFEGWVRNENEGRAVHRLEYEAYAAMAEKEGQRIVGQAIERFGLSAAHCVHRVGSLEIGDMAVWVGTSSPHRGESFDACRFIIDQIKVRLPIWKKEHYQDGDSGWVNCERCAEHGHAHQHEPAHAHEAGGKNTG